MEGSGSSVRSSFEVMDERLVVGRLGDVIGSLGLTVGKVIGKDNKLDTFEFGVLANLSDSFFEV